MSEQKIVLGREHDDDARSALNAVLADFGEQTLEHIWHPDIEWLTIAIGESRVEVEAAAYYGLSVRGEAALVQAIADKVRARMAGQKQGQQRED